MAIFGIKVPVAMEGALGACRRHLQVAAAFSAFINILYLAPTIYMLQVYDRVVPTGGLTTLAWITLVLAIAIGAMSALEAVRTDLMANVSNRLDRILAGEILERLIARRKATAEALPPGQVMREFDTLRSVITGPAMTAVFDAPWTPIFLLAAFLIHPALGVFVLASAVLLGWMAWHHARQARANENMAKRVNARSYQTQESTIRRAEVVRALGMRNALITRHLGDRAAGVEATGTVQASTNRYNAWVKFIRMLLQSLALGLGAWLAVMGSISVGSIIAVSVLLSRALQPVEQLARSWPAIVQARQAVQGLDELFEQTEDPGRNRTLLPTPVGQLAVDKLVVRSPDGNSLLLKGVSFALEPGEICGVIGASGAGKTTLARVLSGAIAPDMGEVRIDGAKMTDWDPERLAPHIGYLPQETGLLPGTVAENIGRFQSALGGDREAFDQRVVRAAELAGVHQMVLGLPKGYDTVIEVGGHALSAGQAQRVALARAIYGMPRLVVLDEPNSALDSEGEMALHKALVTLREAGATIVVIAHRPQVLGLADKLLVLREGEVAQFGPRDAVLAALKAAAEQANVVPLKREV